MILNFSQECYYLKNKVGVVDFTKARGLVKFQSPLGPLGICKIYYSHFIFEVMYHYLEILKSKIGRKNHYSQILCFDRIFEIRCWKEEPLLPKIVFRQNFCMKGVQFSFWFSHLSLVLLLISSLTNKLRLHQFLRTCLPQ